MILKSKLRTITPSHLVDEKDGVSSGDKPIVDIIEDTPFIESIPFEFSDCNRPLNTGKGGMDAYSGKADIKSPDSSVVPDFPAWANPKTKIAAAILGAVLLMGIAYFVYKKMKKTEAEELLDKLESSDQNLGKGGLDDCPESNAYNTYLNAGVKEGKGTMITPVQSRWISNQPTFKNALNRLKKLNNSVIPGGSIPEMISANTSSFSGKGINYPDYQSQSLTASLSKLIRTSNI